MRSQVRRSLWSLTCIGWTGCGLTVSSNVEEKTGVGDAPPPFVQLFDGETLSGWHAVPDESASDWSVRDGAIRGLGSENRLSYLVWEDAGLTDFDLRLRYRMLTNGNTGVEVRAQPDASGKRPFVGYHADLGHPGIGAHILGAWDFHFAGRKEYPCKRGKRLVIRADGSTRYSDLDPSIALRLSDVRRRAWNDLRVLARGSRFQMFINGRLASEFSDEMRHGRLEYGAIALQLHDKGMRVAFKDIRLRRLAASWEK